MKNILPFGEIELHIPMTIRMTELLTTPEFKEAVHALYALRDTYDEAQPEPAPVQETK